MGLVLWDNTELWSSSSSPPKGDQCSRAQQRRHPGLLRAVAWAVQSSVVPASPRRAPWEQPEGREAGQGQVKGALWLCQGKRFSLIPHQHVSPGGCCDPGDARRRLLKQVAGFTAPERLKGLHGGPTATGVLNGTVKEASRWSQADLAANANSDSACDQE